MGKITGLRSLIKYRQFDEPSSPMPGDIWMHPIVEDIQMYNGKFWHYLWDIQCWFSTKS